nr:hypothetical protein [uncultured Brumimicrobium sp.]
MKKTEYFISQVGWNQFQSGLDQVKQKRDEFLSTTKIEKIIDEDIKVNGVGNNQTIFVIKLTYY